MTGTEEKKRGSRLGLPLAVLAVGVAFTAWLLLGFSPAPPVPVDDIHRGRPDGEACMDCHAEDGAVPQQASHTNRLNCYSCHQAR